MVYIKSVAIQGFRSFRELHFDDDFSPGHSCFVGRGGSGKSNFFTAVRYVLSAQSSTQDERRNYLHNGVGGTAASGFVEIALDNSDHRLVVDGSTMYATVTIRRSFTVKRDEYRVNGSVFTTSAVASMLENAGFSVSHPYFMVAQFEVKVLSAPTFSDADRLKLLQDVAGASVYEQKKAQSLRQLEEAAEKRKRFDENITMLQGRVNELRGERVAYEEWKELSTRRQAIEYTIHTTRKKEAQRRLTEYREEVEAATAGVSAAREAAAKASAKANECEVALARARHEHTAAQSRAGAARAALQRFAVGEGERAAAASTAAEDETAATARREELEAEKEALEKQLTVAKASIARLRQEAMTARAEASEAARAVRIANDEVLRVRSAAAAQSEFKSARERDAAYRKLAQEGQANAARFAKERDAARAAEAEATAAAASVKEEAEKLAAQAAQQTAERVALLDKMRRDGATKRERAYAAHRAARDECAKLEAEVESRRRAVQAHWAAVQRHGRAPTLAGLHAVEEIVNDLGLQSRYFGPLFKLFRVKNVEAVGDAVDAAGGAALWNVVFADDDAAAAVGAEFNKRRCKGSFRALPLSTAAAMLDRRPTPPLSRRIRTGDVRLDAAEGAVLLDFVEALQPQFQPLLESVFGNTVVVPSVTDAVPLVERMRCNAVTADGDRVEERGAITGGYRGTGGSLVGRAAAAIAETVAVEAVAQRLAAAVASEEAARASLAALEAENSDALMKASALAASSEGLRARAVALDQRARGEEARAVALASQAEELSNLQETAASEAARCEAVIGTPLGATSPQDAARLRTAEAALATATAAAERADAKAAEADDKLFAATAERDAVQGRLNEVEVAAAAALRACEAASAVLLRTSGGQNSRGVAAEQKRLEDAAAAAADAVQKAAAEVADAEKALQTARADFVSASGAVAAAAANDVSQKVRDASAVVAMADDALAALGVPPPADSLQALQEFRNEAALFKELKRVVTKLRSIGGVNARAFEELRSMDEALEQLLASNRKLEEEKGDVESMIDSLDQQRDSALEATYNNVRQAFAQVFSRLAGRGATGSLEIDHIVDPVAKRRVPAGARLNVQFGHGESGRLSGGQATIASLALLFAIQQCDPAPFYLFDEIDAALDRDVRDRLAEMVAERADAGSQILTVTHRPELVFAAEGVYFVSYARRESHIRKTAAADAARALELGEGRSRHAGGSRRPTTAASRSDAADEEPSMPAPRTRRNRGE